MSDFWNKAEPVVYKSRIKVPYSWQAGETASYFLTQLRDEKKIWGKNCPKCEKTLIPPRKTCPFCFVRTEEWIQVSDEGTVETDTITLELSSLGPGNGGDGDGGGTISIFILIIVIIAIIGVVAVVLIIRR